MIVKVKLNDTTIFRTVNRNNIRKVAKSIHAHFPDSNYPALEGIIFNAYVKGKNELELNGPIAQGVEQSPYKG